LLKDEKVKTNSEKISLTAFPKGVYILKVVTNKNVYSKKIIVN
ncbi:MAG TPA: T9SS type A sorting domain-containing protein, partial [Bacteroidales bacterium]|nr:T9SS type A sorting domain-containing protein [Bacteroidales bacterium]